ncbi:MAG: GntR family transcriptional regulator [Culicoidibacterales bacterium]
MIKTKRMDTKHMEVYTSIRKQIIDKVYPVGAILPTGDFLAKTYNCSKLTIKKGLDKLVSEGILTRRRGAGTFVLRVPHDESFTLSPNASLINTIDQSRIQSRIHQFSIELPTAAIANKLNIPLNQYIYRITRQRLIDDSPYSIEQIFMPLSVIPGLTAAHLQQSIYNYISHTLQLKMQIVHVNIKGDKATAQDIALLNLTKKDFVMELEKVASLQDGTVFEYSVTRHRYENFNFEAVFVQK